MKPSRLYRGKPALQPLDWEHCTSEQLIERIQETNIIGMGGGGYPTAKKLIQSKLCNSQRFVIANGVDCNPGVSADTTLLKYYMADVLHGLRVVGRILDTIELHLATGATNKQDVKGIPVHKLNAPYPAGYEQIVISEILGIKMDMGAYPSQQGIVVLNVATLFAISEAIHGYPPIDRIITTPLGDKWVTQGTPVSSLGESLHLGGLFIGRPSDPDTCINLTNDAVSKITTKALPCIHCGWCSNNCPIDLNVESIFSSTEKEDTNHLETLQVPSCYECGACVGVCPSNIRLLDYIRKAKKSLKIEADVKTRARQFEERSERHNARIEKKKNTSAEQRQKRIIQKRPWN